MPCVRAVRAGLGYAAGPEEPPIVCETIRAMALHSAAGSAGSEPSSAITASAPCRTHARSFALQPQTRSTQPLGSHCRNLLARLEGIRTWRHGVAWQHHAAVHSAACGHVAVLPAEAGRAVSASGA